MNSMSSVRFDQSAYLAMATDAQAAVARQGGDDFLKLGINLVDFLRHGEFATERPNLDHFVHDALARCANEIVGVHSTLCAGSYQASLQHTRALIEVLMSVNYMFSDLAPFITPEMLQRRRDTVEAATERETTEVRLVKYSQYVGRLQ